MTKRRQMRARITCIAAWRLRQDGLTNREIADRLGIKVEIVPGQLKIGERFAEETKATA